MKLFYDLRLLNGQMHGMARYALEMLRAMLELDSDLAVGALLRKPEYASLLPKSSNLVPISCGFSPYGLGAQLFLPKLLKSLKPDVYHCPFFGPPVRFGGPMVVTVHDLIHLRFEGDYGLKQKYYYRWIVKPALAKARAVFTVSEYSKNDLVELMGVDPGKIVITPNGVDPKFRPLTPEEKKEAPITLGWPEDYILGVGNPKPHKNLESLVKAHRLLKDGLMPDAPPLVLVGVGPGDIEGVEPGPDLVLKKSLKDEDLLLAYGAARAVVVPSTYEGFGLPALEAMACGVPVLTSNKASLPEVVGGAGLVCPPESGSISRALAALLQDEEKMAQLRLAGPQRAASFTWRKSAETALKAYRAVATKGRL